MKIAALFLSLDRMARDEAEDKDALFPFSSWKSRCENCPMVAIGNPVEGCVADRDDRVQYRGRAKNCVDPFGTSGVGVKRWQCWVVVKKGIDEVRGGE